MIQLGIAALLLGWQPNVKSHEPHDYTVSGKAHGHTYSVKFHEEDFKPRGRKILWNLIEGSKEPAFPEGRFRPGFQADKRIRDFYCDWNSNIYKSINGRSAANELAKHTELATLQVTVDGKAWAVPRSLYEDLLDPDLGKVSVRASISKDGRVLNVEMHGATEACPYIAKWTFRKDGKHERIVGDADC